MRLTVACPELHKDDANQLAMVLAFGPPDALTYGVSNWKDADGNLYSVASFDAREEWMIAAQTALQNPEWDSEDTVDMDGANRAQSILYIVPFDEKGVAIDPLANPNRITVVSGEDGLAALALAGLSIVQEEPTPETLSLPKPI